MTNRARREAFTLMELLIAIAIIVLLACVLLPALYQARKHAMRARCANNLREIGMFMFMEYECACIPTNFQLVQTESPGRCWYEPDASELLDGVGSIFCSSAMACPIPPPPPPPPVPPPPPPPPTKLERDIDDLTCPYSDPNPGYVLNTNEPPRISYGILDSVRGGLLIEAWEWIAADSIFHVIQSTNDLAHHRHNDGVNLLLKDGAVQWMRIGEVTFPTNGASYVSP